MKNEKNYHKKNKYGKNNLNKFSANITDVTGDKIAGKSYF